MKSWLILGLGLIVAVILAGCVNRARNTSNSRDVRLIQRMTDRDIPETLEVFDASNLEEELRAAVATPADFWGVVQEGQDNPLANVPVRVTLFDQVLDPFEYPFVGWTELKNVRTDKKGRFKVSGRRAGAVVVNVDEAGYWQEEQGYRTYYYATELRSRNEQPLPTAGSPAVFRLIPKPEDAITVPVSTGAIAMSLDGTPIEVAFSTYSRHGAEPGEGTMRIAVEAGEPQEDGRYDWQCRFEVPDGGVQLRRQLFVKEAPAEGYQRRVSMGYEADDPNWDHREDYLLFVRDRDGLYAHFILRVRTRNHPFVSLQGVYNPTGARYGD